MSPGQYIVKVDRNSGEPLGDPIEPSELLVHAHRDRHPVEIAAQFLASRLIHVTGNESLVKKGLKGVERLGRHLGRTVGELTGNPQDATRVKRLLGVTTRDYVFQFREPTHLSEREVKTRVLELQKQARAQLAALGKRPRFLPLPGDLTVLALRLAERLGFQLPLSSDNLRGLKRLRAFDVEDDLRRIGLDPRPMRESLARIRWEELS